MVASFNPDGRPTKYKGEETDRQVYKFALLGLSDVEMAGLLEIHQSTFYEWKIAFPSFSESLSYGKEKADAEVAHKLYDRACGAEWEEEQAFKVKVGQHEEKIQIVKVKKVAPPDTGAISLWLSNRQRGKWKIKQENTLVGDPNNPVVTIDASKLTTQELLAYKNAIADIES